ncbi:MAG: hypothetical protein KGJ13_10700 [Patescibacteria group bacterium]|nr:hypothetical protein [Patescibacteria group bacterium]
MADDFRNRPGQGVLFTNKTKGSERAPDFKGTLHIPEGTVVGQHVKIAGWKRQTAHGDLISLQIDNRTAEKYPREVPQKRGPSDVPF